MRLQNEKQNLKIARDTYAGTQHAQIHTYTTAIVGLMSIWK